ncbi:hypothetical protein D3C71_1113240 [compost metagenome]
MKCTRPLPKAASKRSKSAGEKHLQSTTTYSGAATPLSSESKTGRSGDCPIATSTNAPRPARPETIASLDAGEGSMTQTRLPANCHDWFVQTWETSTTRGSFAKKTAPCPGLPSIHVSPPIRPAIRRVMFRPRPLPRPFDRPAIRGNGSNSPPDSCGATPGPQSRTANVKSCNRPLTLVAVTSRTTRPGPPCRMAFWM